MVNPAFAGSRLHAEPGALAGCVNLADFVTCADFADRPNRATHATHVNHVNHVTRTACTPSHRSTHAQSAVSPPFGSFACAFLPGAGDHAGRVLRCESMTTR
ncbi:Uncharacterised protein [Burkholderia pseudomallei]|nr:hypothetical protein DM55_3898 [Burkholderia mallei]AIP02307.1 hypothetical protein DP51_4961 [Burkholderia pseudomallei]AIS26950.1 hypothetical protein BM44_3857 [Burkholderia mallei NCTC 10247]AIS91125.1 hypothetical protein BBU_5940 [Burkholderia pseudomallei NAU35A-3]AJX56952.1 hypothetical protein DP47_3800 [Burkholderia pseudomallei Pasteur 52237]AJX92149.1 hypothetical protein BG24_3802 [Burkholderia pseudomallei PB08298010]KGU91619.1 hypothetical protein X880_5143 [Burkholderia pse